MIFNLKKNWDNIHLDKLFKIEFERKLLSNQIKRHLKFLKKNKIKDFESYIYHDKALRDVHKLLSRRFEIEKKLLTADDKGAFKNHV